MSPRLSLAVAVACALVCALHAALPPAAAAQDAPPAARRVVEPVETLPALKRVSAAHTPSGLPVPRYVSLKSSRTNGRTGPSRDHAIAWTYTQRGLPVVVVAETEMWRRVRDHRGDESWVAASLLSGRRRALAFEDTPVRKRADARSRERARLGPGAVVALGECRDGWCEVEASSDTGGRVHGWALQAKLWGAAPL